MVGNILGGNPHRKSGVSPSFLPEKTRKDEPTLDYARHWITPGAALQPHKSRYWLNTTEKDPEQFPKQVETVCDTYRAAPALERTQNTHTVCVDEVTGIQALERTAPTKLRIAGKPARIEFEYERHGTLILISNFQVTIGELIAPTLGPTRTEADCASHIEQTVATDPGASWAFVTDNLNIHGRLEVLCSTFLLPHSFGADKCRLEGE
jgi:DDE superfamily endonuclease